MYEGSFTLAWVITMLHKCSADVIEIFEKKIWPGNHLKHNSFVGDHFISCTGTDTVPDQPNFDYELNLGLQVNMI